MKREISRIDLFHRRHVSAQPMRAILENVTNAEFVREG